MKRNNTREVIIGNVAIGRNNPIAIQSMCNTKTTDIEQTVNQINRLERAGCEIVRVAVMNRPACESLKGIKERINIPLVADIHFDYKLALLAIEAGVDKLRLNPGNIGSEDRVREVVEAAKKKDIPIRIGVNSGSLQKDILKKYGKVTAQGLVESALYEINLFKKFDYENIVISIKSSDVPMSIEAHEMLANLVNYPIHIGITESGTIRSGTIKSSVGLGVLLNKGIGDTMRVSLTSDPVEEISVAKSILQTLGLRKNGIEVISCPTCGRTQIDLIGLANKVEKMAEDIDLDIKVAVMGCVVNGPGEAKEADIGIAGGNGVGVIIKKGKIHKKVREEELLNELRYEILNWEK